MIKLRRIHISTETPLILVEGEMKTITSDDTVEIETNGESVKWPLIGNTFRAFVHLKKNKNTVNVSIGKHTSRMTAIFEQIPKSGLVELIYVTCEDERNEEKFNQNIKSSKNKISLLALLTQYFYSNTTSKKSTFNLKLNSNNMPKVNELTLKKSLNELITMSQYDLWEYVAEQLLKSPLYSSSSKYFAVTSFDSSFSEDTKIALAAGGLSLIGCYIINDLEYEMPSDLTSWFKQSNSSSSAGVEGSNNYTITNWIGSCIHEMGHMFDLGHSEQGVMSGNFESLSSYFLQGKKDRFWSPSSLEILSRHKWLNKHPSIETSSKPFTYTNGIIKSQHGISVAEWRNTSGLVLNYEVYTLPAKIFRLNYYKQVNSTTTTTTASSSYSNASEAGNNDLHVDENSKKTLVLMDIFGNLFKTD